MSSVHITYYTRKRTTPFFLTEEEILSHDYDSFKERIINNVPHLARADAPLQFSVIDGNLDVDLSPTYFKRQVKDLLQKGNEITIQAIAFESSAAGGKLSNNAITATVTNKNR